MRHPRYVGDIGHEIPSRAPATLLVDNGLSVEYWRSRWARLESDYSSDYGGVRERTTVARLLVAEKPVGRFDLCEYRVDTFTSREVFFSAMDNHSHSACALASEICAHWEEVANISDYGDILELSRAWIDPRHSRGGRLTLAIKAAINELHPKHSLLMLKAFPLEYEGATNADNVDAFRLRQQALMRHYRRTLGVIPMPDQEQETGWMYRIAESLCDVDCIKPAHPSEVPPIDWGF